jgi:hypothetical protein
MSMVKKRNNSGTWRILGCSLLLTAASLLPGLLNGKDRTWTFTSETVDLSTRFTSLAVDAMGNVHLAYTNDDDRVKYAFRDRSTSKWFTTEIDTRASFTAIVVDEQGNPHLCYTQRTMRYAFWDGKVWHKEEISPGTGTIAYYCGVAVSSAGIPHVTWYQERTAQDTNYLHMRHAVLQDGQWMVKTIDWDAQTGKWNSLVLDSEGNPHISFDAFVSGQLKYASWNGKGWLIRPVDSRAGSDQPGRGMGNCLVLDPHGRPMISYFEEGALKYARQLEDGRWSIEILAPSTVSPTWAGYRSGQALDSKGFPHVVYEDTGTLRHLYWDGTAWRTQRIEISGPRRLRYASIAISKEDIIYVSYSDHEDGSLKVAVGRPGEHN